MTWKNELPRLLGESGIFVWNFLKILPMQNTFLNFYVQAVRLVQTKSRRMKLLAIKISK